MNTASGLRSWTNCVIENFYGTTVLSLISGELAADTEKGWKLWDFLRWEISQDAPWAETMNITMKTFYIICSVSMQNF